MKIYIFLQILKKRNQMTKYIVTFKFHDDIRVYNPITEYPSICVQIKYEKDKLRSIIHTFYASEDLSREQCVRCSKQQLRLLWELLEYRYGYPIVPSSSHVRVEGQAADLTASVGTSIDAILCRDVILPKDEFFSRHRLRLSAWLRFVNDARNTPSDPEAVRLYYAVWEDMKGRPDRNNPIESLHLKYTRDFVSHGEELKNKELLKFLKEKLKQETDQFDPANQIHRRFVKDQRNQARKLIEREIDKELNSYKSKRNS